MYQKKGFMVEGFFSDSVSILKCLPIVKDSF